MPVSELGPETAFTEPQYYNRYTGDYCRVGMLQSYDLDAPLDLTMPSVRVPYDLSVENFLFRRVDDLLQQAQEPVVVMDIGAAAALTLLRLSNRNEQAIRESRLAVVATNLRLRVADFISQLGVADTEEARTLYAKAAHVPHEIYSDFMPGQTYSITLPNGAELDLTGGVDIIHEQLSLTAWGTQLGEQIPEVGKFISPRGIYMVRSADIVLSQPNRQPRDKLARSGLATAHRTISERHSLTTTSRCEAGPHQDEDLRYLVFKGSAAAPVAI